MGRTKTNMQFKYIEKPLIVVYFDVNYQYQYVKDTQFIRNKVLEIAKHFVDSNLKFAIANEEEFEDEIKSLALEDSGSDVNVACFTDKQKFRMEPVDDFETSDLEISGSTRFKLFSADSSSDPADNARTLAQNRANTSSLFILSCIRSLSVFETKPDLPC